MSAPAFRGIVSGTGPTGLSTGLSRIVAAALLASVGLSQAAFAESCAQLTTYGLKDFEAAPDTAAPRSVFHLNEPFVMCVQLETSKFVTVWDAPPKGFAPERLYPNNVSHPKQSIRAVKLAAGRHCYGTGARFHNDDAFPLVQDEGPGKGKISVVATNTADDQPTLEDYAIPGRTLKPEVASNLSRIITVEAAKACDAISSAQADYEVIK
jgi:hypothetical protein